MGAWGTGLYSDDTTCDVRDDYIRLLKSGASREDATKQIYSQYADLLDDRQVECLVVLAIADTQWRYGHLLPSVKERALKLLAEGADLKFWELDAPAEARARRRVLDKLKIKLTSPLPEPKVIKITRKRRVISADERALFLLPIEESRYVPLVLLGFHEMEKTIEPLFCALPLVITDAAQKISSELLNQEPIVFETELGPRSVFGAFPEEGSHNSWKKLIKVGKFVGGSLPKIPDTPTFFSFSGVVIRIERIFRAEQRL